MKYILATIAIFITLIVILIIALLCFMWDFRWKKAIERSIDIVTSMTEWIIRDNVWILVMLVSWVTLIIYIFPK